MTTTTTYSNNLGITLIGTGQQAGTWGTTTNTNFELLDEAINGVVTLTLSATGSTGSPNDQTIADGTSSTLRHKYINVTSGSDLGGTVYLRLLDNAVEKIAIIKNSLAGSQSLVLIQGTYDAANVLTLANGKTVVAKFDGGGTGATVVNALGDLAIDAVETVSVTANNSTNESVFPVFVDGATGAQGLESDTGFTYNPSTGVLTTTSVTGNLTGNVTGNVTGDLTGNVSGNVTGNTSGSSGSCTGNSATATALASARTITLAGDVTSSAVSFDGSANITITTAQANNSVDLTTHTTGNYVASVSGGTGVTVDVSASEGATPTLSIGQDVQTTASVQFTSLGVGASASGTAGEIRATNDITAFFSSDERLKENICYIEEALDKVAQIQGVEFDWTDDYMQNRGGEDGLFVRKHDVGLIAQDVEKVLPEVVANREDGFKAIKYDRVVALLVNAVHELTNKVEELEVKLES